MNENSNLDILHLQKYVADDSALRDEVLSIFAEQAELLMAAFDISLSDQSWGDAAHALKGAARGVGAWAVGDLCEEAEMLIGDTPAKLENRASLLVSIREKLGHSLAEAKALQQSN